MVSVCLPSDALLQHLPSYLGFSYLGRGVSLHGCSSKAQPLCLTSSKVRQWLPPSKCPMPALLHSICQQIWKTQQWPEDWKRSVFNSIPKKGNAKECSNYRTIALISHASKVMLKILQARLRQYMDREFLMFKFVLEKTEEPGIKLPTSAGSSKKQESSRKTHLFLLY